ncbi:unnamed protein product [Paramecium pentaurelia]|uniref:Uncharacterized protein n=1 Tax=Paramecium pentaurelia TaxID=43138 RepID=A0A8S1UHC5_9CILI|nr:unnamed protein product [Paramecium pentaurelia]
MVKCLWCLKELGIFGMLFHKAVCLEYLYSKSLDKLKQAKQSQLITKEQYLNEKRHLREYFMSRFKPKVYEAFIKRQKEQQYILINPNELSVGLESDIDVISKKVCFESQEISQKSQFLESFQNQIEPDYNYVVNNYSGNLEVYITNQLVNDDPNNNNDKQIDTNKHDEMNIHHLEIQNLGNIHKYNDQHDKSQDQSVQFQQNIIQHQNRDDIKEKPLNIITQSNEEQKENILFKLLQKRANPKSQKELNKSITQNQNVKQTHTRSKSRKIKDDLNIYETKAEIHISPIQQEELATEIKSIGITDVKTNKKKPPKFSQSLDKINSKINQKVNLQIENQSKIELKKLQRMNIDQIQKSSKFQVSTKNKLNNSQNDCQEKSIQRGIIKTRFQASLDNQKNQAKTKNLKIRDKQKIKKK